MTVALVRKLIADFEQVDTASAVGDGDRTRFALPNAPVVADSQEVRVNGSLKTEGVDYAIADETGLVVFTAAPADGAAVVVDYRFSLLSDATLADLLTLEGNDDRLAAAQGLDVIASSETLVQKRIKVLDLSTDGPAVARALREHAVELRRQVEAGQGDYDGAVDWAEMVVDEFGARERLVAEALRSA